jgi:hypothetical protein
MTYIATAVSKAASKRPTNLECSELGDAFISNMEV